MRWAAVWVFLLLIVACYHKPPIQPVGIDRQTEIQDRCRSIYPKGRWQLVHTIRAKLFGGRQTTLTGVIELSTGEDSIHCVLMTLEGFVLFEAVDDGRISVKKAYGPFADPDIARGMMADIRLLFLHPEGAVQTVGQMEGDGEACRFLTKDNRVVDVIGSGGGNWRIQQYNPAKTVIVEAVDADGLSPHLTLKSRGKYSYQLSMTLTDAVPISN